MTTESAPAATAETHGGGHGGGGHGGGTTAIIAALLANLGIAAAKFIAFFVTGASSMLAEGIHSVADSGNQVLLLIGGRRARRAATPEHPFGFGRDRYIYGFLVAIVLFSVGGVFAVSEGVRKAAVSHYDLPPEKTLTVHNLFDIEKIDRLMAEPLPEAEGRGKKEDGEEGNEQDIEAASSVLSSVSLCAASVSSVSLW